MIIFYEKYSSGSSSAAGFAFNGEFAFWRLHFEIDFVRQKKIDLQSSYYIHIYIKSYAQYKLIKS